MKTLTYQKPHDLSGLHDELLAAVPSLRPADGRAAMSISGAGDAITLVVPSASNTAAIDAVVAAHDPAPWVASRAALIANEATLREHADDALVANAAYLGHTPVPDGTLTAAQLSAAMRQAVDQIDALTRQTNKLIRLVLRRLEATD